jgi:C1A family cysteine protease
VGWYHNKDKTQWGCYQASKVGVNPDEITYFDTKNNVNIVDPFSKPQSDTSIINSFLNMNFIEKKTVLTYREDVKNSSNKKKLTSRFLKNSSFLAEKEFMMLKLDSSFKAHSLYLNKLNNLNKLWTAEIHPKFSNLSIKELNKFAGIARPRITEKVKLKRVFQEDVSMFPKRFDWKHKTKVAGTQGNCGSCYTYSTIRMIETRLKILFDHDVNLSIQHPLDCSFYNQGCNGGYPYLTMKFANEFGLIPEMCKPYAVIIAIISFKYRKVI